MMKAWVLKLVNVRDTPEALARGLAVGFFFGASFFGGYKSCSQCSSAISCAATRVLGTTVVGAVGAVVVYFSSQRIITALRAWHAKRHPRPTLPQLASPPPKASQTG